MLVAGVSFTVVVAACSSQPAPSTGTTADSITRPITKSTGSPTEMSMMASGPADQPELQVAAGVKPGSSCNCDTDCRGTKKNPAICVYGVCMTKPSAACSAGGSRVECGAGSRCWSVGGSNTQLCWPDCASFHCAGSCDADGSCLPTNAGVCDQTCGGLCPPPVSTACSASVPNGTCSTAGDACIDGTCTPTCSTQNPSGYCAQGLVCTEGSCQAAPTAACPDWKCTGTGCTDIIAMPGSTDPNSARAHADGYYLASPLQYSYIRRDLSMMVRFGACQVMAKFPNTQPLGLGDLTQANAQTPGTDVGAPRHPAGTHMGNDMDIAYYQTTGVNTPTSICGDGSDRNGNGIPGVYNDGYFCTTNTNIVDWNRETFWFGMLAQTPLVRVFGIDQTLINPFTTGLTALETNGTITNDVLQRALILGYGLAGGWEYHFHHSHMSYVLPTQ